jgi:hypothetical protein
MSKHPMNLALRFLLELAGLAALAYWGWAWGDPWRWPLAIGLPMVAAIIWATFRTPGDQTANQKAPVPVHGIIRLSIEMTFFGLAIVALFTAQSSNDRAELAGSILTLAVLAHYILSWDRVMWLLLMRIGERTPEDELNWPAE